MRMNWGTGVAIALTVFIAFICTLVFTVMSKKVDLVAKDYYKQELEYQDVIDAKMNYKRIGEELVVKDEGGTFTFTIPGNPESLKGEVRFVSDFKADRDVKIPLLNTVDQSIAKEKIIPGNYTLFVTWESEDQLYCYEDGIVVR